MCYYITDPFFKEERANNLSGKVTGRVVRRCGLAVRRKAGQRKDLDSIRFGSSFSSKIVVYGHCLVTLPTQLMKTLKWLTQLPTLMQSHSSGDSVVTSC